VIGSWADFGPIGIAMALMTWCGVFGVMAVVRATALAGFPEVVRAARGDPDRLLAEVGIDSSQAGRSDVFIPLRSAVTVLEIAAQATATPDLGRRLSAVQGIDILGPVGVAARTSRTVAEALQIFERFLGAYSPELGLRVTERDTPGRSFIDYQILDPDVPASPQHAELALGVILRVLRHLLGDLYRDCRHICRISPWRPKPSTVSSSVAAPNSVRWQRV
jgi:hypothetical protein